jgi:hypothetical protein
MKTFIGGSLLLSALSALALLLGGCVGMMPERTVNGVAVYIRPRSEVEAYCYSRIRASDRQPHIYGCYVKGDRIIMAEAGTRPDGSTEADTIAHELRHADGWDHRGPCHSLPGNANGIKPDGTPCEWFRP